MNCGGLANAPGLAKPSGFPENVGRLRPGLKLGGFDSPLVSFIFELSVFGELVSILVSTVRCVLGPGVDCGDWSRLGNLDVAACFSLIDFVSAMSKILLTCCGAFSTKKLNALSPQPAFDPMMFTCAIVVASALVIISVVTAVL